MKGFFKTSLVYLVAEILVRSTNLILTPYYIAKLSIEDIGILSILLASYTIFQKILNFGFQSGYTRYAFNSFIKKQGIFSSVWIHLFINISVTVLFYFILKSIGQSNYFLKISILVLLTSSMRAAIVNNGLAILRVKEKALTTGVIGFISSLATIIIILLLFEKAYDPIFSIAIGNFIGVIITSIIILVVLRNEIKDFWPIKTFKKIFKYSKNLTLHGIFQWGLVSGDRFILLTLLNKEILGGYFVMYQLPLLSHMFFRSLNNALLPRYSKVVNNDFQSKQNELKELASEVKVYLKIVILASICSLFLTFLLFYFSSINFLVGDYGDYISIIPCLLSGSFFMAMYYQPMNLITIVEGKTKNISSITFLSLITGFIINLIFLKTFGVKIAAFASMTSFAILFLIILKKSTKFDYDRKILPTKMMKYFFVFMYVSSSLTLIFY